MGAVESVAETALGGLESVPLPGGLSGAEGLAQIPGAIVQIASALRSGLAELGELGEVFIKIALKLVELLPKFVNLIDKAVPLIELTIFAAPVMAQLGALYMWYNSLKQIDFVQSNPELRAGLEYAAVAVFVLVTLYVYSTAGLGWIEFLPDSASSGKTSFTINDLQAPSTNQPMQIESPSDEQPAETPAPVSTPGKSAYDPDMFTGFDPFAVGGF